MLRVVDRVTPITQAELISGMAEGFYAAMGTHPPRPETLAVLVAQACLETANGKKVHGYNLGNVKAGDSWAGHMAMYECDERFPPTIAQGYLVRAAGALPRTDRVDGGPTAWLKSKNRDGTWTIGFAPDHLQCRFRAFDSAADGCRAFVEFFTSGHLADRYARAWSAAYAGEPARFVAECGKAGYFTADVDTYSRTLCSIFRRSLPACAGLGLGMGLDDADRETIGALVAATASEIAFHKYGTASDLVA